MSRAIPLCSLPTEVFSSLSTDSTRTRLTSQNVDTARTLKHSSKSTNFYEVLHVKNSASQSEIKAAYRHLAKLFHPDAASSTDPYGSEFVEIHTAYATLSDPEARAQYDQSINGENGLRYSTMAGRSRSGLQPYRRWETDQCW